MQARQGAAITKDARREGNGHKKAHEDTKMKKPLGLLFNKAVPSCLFDKVFRVGHSPPHRGGVDATSRRCREASFEERTGWSLTSHISECVLNTACERPPFLMAAPYCLMFRAIALTLRAGLRGLRPPSAPLRRLRDIFLVA